MLMVRSELTAEDSLAAMRARSRFGIAMAAIIRMIATTIRSSINEKPFCFFKSLSSLVRSRSTSWASCIALGRPQSEEAKPTVFSPGMEAGLNPKVAL